MAYSPAQAARLCGATPVQLERWSDSGLVVPASPGSYEFRDLVALRVVVSLHRAGLSTARISRALGYLAEAGEDLADLRIVTDGTSVWACRTDGEILDALRRGQLALFVAVEQYVAETDAAVRAFDADRRAFVDQFRDPSRAAVGS